MPLELRQDHVILRVEGDVLEIFRRGTFSERLPLAWLAVQVQPSVKGSLILRIMSAHIEMPLYEVIPKARVGRGSAIDLVISTGEQPLFRQFFTQVALLCDRPVGH